MLYKEVALPTEDLISSNVRMGQYVDVEMVNDYGDRFESYLIGVKNNSYLILEQPDVSRYGVLRDKLVRSLEVVIRTVCEKTTGDCIAFRSRVTGSVNFPHRLFFISFPDKIETHELRSEKRQNIRKKAVIFKDAKGRRIEGVVTDISEGGCRFEFEVDEAIKGIKPGDIYIELEEPQQGKLVRLAAKVCSQRKDQKKVLLGLAFSEKFPPELN